MTKQQSSEPFIQLTEELQEVLVGQSFDTAIRAIGAVSTIFWKTVCEVYGDTEEFEHWLSHLKSSVIEGGFPSVQGHA